MGKSKILNVIVLFVCILVVGIMGFFLGLALRNAANVNSANTNGVVKANTNVNAAVNTNAVTNVNQNNTNTITTTDIAAVVDAGVTWSTPAQLDDLNLFSTQADTSAVSEVTYYQVGSTTAGENIILAEVSWDSPSPLSIARFVKSSAGKYTILSNLSNSDAVSGVASTVTVDNSRTFASLQAPATLAVAGVDLVAHEVVFSTQELYSQFQAESTDSAFSTLGQSAYGQVVTVVRPLNTPASDSHGVLNVKSYVQVLNDGSMATYADKKDFLSDDGSLKGTLTADYASFTSRTYQLGLIRDGCGGFSGDETVEGLVDDNGQISSGLTKIGTTPSGDSLYTATDSSLQVLSEAYDAYSIGRGDDASNPVLNFTDFVAQHPLVLWQDQQGDVEVFMDADFAAAVECGKPVIYLYPTTPTNVSVQVGAQVTLSDPLYQAGWTVLAQPNGALTTASGQTYGNLFWEGKGSGVYPAITQGRVVARVNIESELRHDLAAQGLNATESQDFLNFWLPRMPQTPFIRLTWIGTQGMNRLAPLTVSPTPNSMIRVFLDFAGQQTATTTLAPQTLHAALRTGFTLVEWGGLLTGN